MRVKICGITKPEQAVAIANLGATALGFICFPKSPRYISPEKIEEICRQLPKKIAKIGVFVNANSQEIVERVNAGLTGVQLHGEENPAFCQELRQLLPEIELLKALRIKTTESLALADTYAHCVDTLLLDAYHPQLAGGTGKTLDWNALKQFRPPLPWLLAGGLTPDNILEALEELNPDGIDLSSGVEIAPGDKDLAKVMLLFKRLAQVRE